jgi:hypothetical protein
MHPVRLRDRKAKKIATRRKAECSDDDRAVRHAAILRAMGGIDRETFGVQASTALISNGKAYETDRHRHAWTLEHVGAVRGGAVDWGVQIATPLPTVKVQPSRRPATCAHARTGQGTHRTAGYQENDITAAKFGSKHW